MWRVLNVVEQMSTTLICASTHLKAVLEAMDEEMAALETRLHSDATSLRTSIGGANLSAEDRDMLLTTLARIENTAESVAAFAHRHQETESPSAT